MTPEQWATLAGVGSVLVWPTWQGVKAGFWNVATRLWPDTVEPAGDDLMDVAEAMAVTPIDVESIINWHSQSPVLADASLTSALAAWSIAAAAHPYVDHAPCEGPDCDQTICCCPAAAVGLPCRDTVQQECLHHQLLCADCRTECVDCRTDARDDSGVQW